MGGDMECPRCHLDFTDLVRGFERDKPFALLVSVECAECGIDIGMERTEAGIDEDGPHGHTHRVSGVVKW